MSTPQPSVAVPVELLEQNMIPMKKTFTPEQLHKIGTDAYEAAHGKGRVRDYAELTDGTKCSYEAIAAAVNGALLSAPQGPVAWLHVMHREDFNEPLKALSFDDKNPFGRPGSDYSPSYTVTSHPLWSALE